jgi:disulfide bond formation protein DsbB
MMTMPYAALAIIAVSVVSLVSAFTAEIFFDIKPCILCLFQRVPYAVTLVFASLAFLLRKDEKNVRILFSLTALAFFVNVGIAFFHTGVERHWWAGTNGCAVMPLNAPLTREQLLTMAVAQCDEINFEIFGLSFANLNVLLCLGMGFFALLSAFGQSFMDRMMRRCQTNGCCCHKSDKS